MDTLVIGDAPLTIGELVEVARYGRKVAVGDAARARLAAARAVVDQVIAEERVAYGVTTGFGQLATTHIPVDKVRELQQNLVRSHAVGVGEPLPREVVRGAMLIRASTMSQGLLGRARTRSSTCSRPCSTPTSCPTCRRAARSARPATSRRRPISCSP